MPEHSDVAVVGGGVIGLACAWRLAAAGHDVTVHDPAPASGASWVAGGMLAPVTEAEPGEEAALALGSAALDRWPGFAGELAAHGDSGLRTDGTLVVAVDPGDRAELDRLGERLARLGREIEVLRGRALRRAEPLLGSEVRSALSVRGDLSVDNRALLRALLAACRAAGVRFSPHRCDTVPASPVVLIAAGACSGALHPMLRDVVRPVKGEIVRLRARRGALPPPSRTVRALVGGRPCYLVPRDGGRVVLGATQEEVGFDTEVTAGGVRRLLADAVRVLPAVEEYALEESSAGLRPGSPDGLPLIGVLSPGVLVATGHGRGGVLLAPITAEAVLALLRGEAVPSEVAAADVARFPVSGPVGRRHAVDAPGVGSRV